MEFSSYRNNHLLFKTNAFFAYILYFISLSCVGYGILKALNPRTDSTPRSIDFFFTSVSAATVSSISVVEMEVFSNAQLIAITALMFLGGEVFTSMIRLHLVAFKRWRPESSDVSGPDPFHRSVNHEYDCIKFLGFLVFSYLVVIQILGITSVWMYLALVSSAKKVLSNKGIKSSTFAVFSIVSTFANCGFIPTNENMIVFRKNSGLLWILLPQILLGNTLFPAALRLVIWVFGVKLNRVEAKYLVGNSVGYGHLLPSLHTLLLAATALGFALIGFVMFCSMEWNAQGLGGMNGYEKVVAILFQCINARHSGESILDLSTISPAILVFFIIIMYLPPYTSYLPIEKEEEQSLLKYEEKEKGIKIVMGNLILSQLSYLAILIIVICITERKSLREDPLNFSVLNITLEVISAYGNVGFTSGYSCDRQVIADPKCVNKWYGFSGKWSDEGKIVLIAVMFFGRLKQFNTNGGQAWMLL